MTTDDRDGALRGAKDAIRAALGSDAESGEDSFEDRGLWELGYDYAQSEEYNNDWRQKEGLKRSKAIAAKCEAARAAIDRVLGREP
jgi:hypothetical protein